MVLVKYDPKGEIKVGSSMYIANHKVGVCYKIKDNCAYYKTWNIAVGNHKSWEKKPKENK